MKIDDRVIRNEIRANTGATILAIDGENALIAYDEGGRGWWPLDALTARVPSSGSPIPSDRIPT